MLPHLPAFHSTIYDILEILQLTPWPESASEIYRPSDRRLLTKLVPTFADRGCHAVGVTDPFSRILAFLDRPLCVIYPLSFE
jgi:hypothetical protein